jgi:hypothetical protein
MTKSKFSSVFKRELEVAFSKNAQPIWFRLLKYTLIGLYIYFFWSSDFFWTILLVVLGLSLLLHFWYRYKTNGWKKSYGGWDFNKNKSNLED